MTQRRIALALAIVVGLVPSSVGAGSAQMVHALTLSANGSTLTVSVGDSVALRLPAQMDWDVSSTNQGVLVPAPGPLAPDEQGLWQAAAPGQSVITANGRASCNPGEACPQLIVHFQAMVEVVAGESSVGDAVTYAAGWNLVAGPAGASFPVAAYTWDPLADQYRQLSPNQSLQAGSGYWAYFNQATTVTLPDDGPNAVSVLLPPGQWVQVGNPSATASATVTGADAVDTYSPALAAYAPSTTLAPGQGAWAYSGAGSNAQISIASTAAPLPVLDTRNLQERPRRFAASPA